MYLYAIKELNTGLFVTHKSLNYDIEPLCDFTLFFNSEQAAKRAMVEKHMDVEFNPITKVLAWNEIENLYKVDRWNISMSKEEFEGWESRYDLKVVKLYIGEIEYEEDDD